MEKSCRKCAPKTNPRSLLILVSNQKQSLHERNSFKDKILKEDYQKALKRLTLFFLSNPVPFNVQYYGKQKELGTSEQLIFRLQNKIMKVPQSVVPDQV